MRISVACALLVMRASLPPGREGLQRRQDPLDLLAPRGGAVLEEAGHERRDGDEVTRSGFSVSRPGWLGSSHGHCVTWSLSSVKVKSAVAPSPNSVPRVTPLKYQLDSPAMLATSFRIGS